MRTERKEALGVDLESTVFFYNQNFISAMASRDSINLKVLGSTLKRLTYRSAFVGDSLFLVVLIYDCSQLLNIQRFHTIVTLSTRIGS